MIYAAVVDVVLIIIVEKWGWFSGIYIFNNSVL